MQAFRLPAAVTSVIAAAVIALIPSSGWAHKHGDAGPSTGLRTIAYAKVPPDFNYDVGRGPTHLAAQFGKPIVINFWATWCKPCLDEMDAFNRLQTEYGDRATLITLSAEDPGIARTWVKAHDSKLPVSEDPLRKVFDAYSIGPIPVTLVLRPDGTVAHVSVGELDWLELQAAIDAALRVTARAERPGGQNAEDLEPAHK